MQWIFDPWPWYVGGPVLSLVVLSLTFLGKRFGVSSSFVTTCSILGAGKKWSYFAADWKKSAWNLLFLLGAVIGGFVATRYLGADVGIDISDETVKSLAELGIKHDKSYLPLSLFSIESLGEVKTWIILVLGGLLSGFGVRWAGGCTSGHAISGLANLQWPSLLAVIGFFAGGLVMTHFLLPFIFGAN